MSWFWTIMFLSFAIVNTSESKLHHHHHHQKSSAIVIGTVYCDTCFQQNLPKTSQFLIAGASVTIECKDTGSGTRFRKQVKTDGHGEFKVHLPFPAFEPPVQDPPSLGSFLPPLPRLPPLPQLPRLPPLPGIPFLPPVVPKKQAANNVPKLSENKPDTSPLPPNSFNLPSIFPPNPFQSPPITIPPVFPSPLPSIFPPLFPSPNSPPLFNLPPLPGLVASPPPPPPLQLPPFPFQPTPGFPGVPPAKVSAKG